MTIPLVIVGGGEHARVVADTVRTVSRFSLRGFIDPKRCEATLRRGVMEHLGGDGALEKFPGAWTVLGVGPKPHDTTREEIVLRLSARVSGWAAVVHARAIVAPDVELGEGCVIMAGAIVQAGARVGRHAVVNSGAVIEHDVALGDFVHVAPGAVLGGGVMVGRGTYVGLAAAVRDHIHIGEGVVVGMGAAVVGDVAAFTEVLGVPARSSARNR